MQGFFPEKSQKEKNKLEIPHSGLDMSILPSSVLQKCEPKTQVLGTWSFTTCVYVYIYIVLYASAMTSKANSTELLPPTTLLLLVVCKPKWKELY